MAGTDTIRIPVSGMTCAACSARVQRALQKQDGVADASVNLMMKTATVEYDPTTVTPNRLIEAIRDTGGSDNAFEPEFAPARLGEIERSCLAVGKARDVLGWQSSTNVREGIAQTLASVAAPSA